MFSQELIWSGEICYTNIVVSRPILKMRREDKLPMKWCISLRFHSVTRQLTFFQTRNIKADHEAAEHFVLHRGLSTNHRRDEIFRKMVFFVCWLAAKYTLLLLTHFRKSRKTNSMAIATTRASAVVAKTLNDVNQTLLLPVLSDGHKHSVTPKQIPTEATVFSFEAVLSRQNEKQSDLYFAILLSTEQQLDYWRTESTKTTENRREHSHTARTQGTGDCC